MQTTIAIDISTKEKLKQLGIKGQTYGDIIEYLVKIAKMHSFLQKQKSILKNEHFEEFEQAFEPVSDERAIGILDRLEKEAKEGKRKTISSEEFFKKYSKSKSKK